MECEIHAQALLMFTELGICHSQAGVYGAVFCLGKGKEAFRNAISV
jgi:hypothetical protein